MNSTIKFILYQLFRFFSTNYYTFVAKNNWYKNFVWYQLFFRYFIPIIVGKLGILYTNYYVHNNWYKTPPTDARQASPTSIAEPAIIVLLYPIKWNHVETQQD